MRLHVFPECFSSGSGPVVWRFQSALGGKEPSRLYPGFASCLQPVWGHRCEWPIKARSEHSSVQPKTWLFLSETAFLVKRTFCSKDWEGQDCYTGLRDQERVWEVEKAEAAREEPLYGQSICVGLLKPFFTKWLRRIRWVPWILVTICYFILW